MRFGPAAANAGATDADAGGMAPGRAVLSMEVAGTEAARKVLVEWAAGAEG